LLYIITIKELHIDPKGKFKMSKNVGMSAKVGKKRQPSNIKWIQYDIDWNRMAKSSCKDCYGRGFSGWEPQTEYEKDNQIPRTFILCDCVADAWTKMTDDERMTYATLKENAEEILNETKETIKEMMSEENSK
jgi:hypothetical protein